MTSAKTQRPTGKKPLTPDDLPSPGQPRDDARLGDHGLARSDTSKLGRSGDRNKLIG